MHLDTTDVTGMSAWVCLLSVSCVENTPVIMTAVVVTSGNSLSDIANHMCYIGDACAGMKLANLSKILKCAGGDDIITMKSDDDGDTITFLFESKNQERLSEFDLKLMDIDSEQLGIPDSEYDATVKMPSAEFQRICKDLSTIGDTVTISVQKDSVKFSTKGDIGAATVMCRQNKSADSEECTEVDVRNPVGLNFALRYLNSFAKATPLSANVTIKLSNELPVLVEYTIPEAGRLGFYLAPKLDDDMEEA